MSFPVYSEGSSGPGGNTGLLGSLAGQGGAVGLAAGILGAIGSVFQSPGRKRQIALRESDARDAGYPDFKTWDKAGQPQTNAQQIRSMERWGTDVPATLRRYADAFPNAKADPQALDHLEGLIVPPGTATTYMNDLVQGSGVTFSNLTNIQPIPKPMSMLGNIVNSLTNPSANQPFDLNNYIKLPTAEVGLPSWVKLLGFGFLFLFLFKALKRSK